MNQSALPPQSPYGTRQRWNRLKMSTMLRAQRPKIQMRDINNVNEDEDIIRVVQARQGHSCWWSLQGSPSVHQRAASRRGLTAAASESWLCHATQTTSSSSPWQPWAASAAGVKAVPVNCQPVNTAPWFWWP